MSLMRWDIINHLIKRHGYKSYLEIGYYKGWSFDRIECQNKVAVDPNPSKTSEQESAIHGSVMDSGNMTEHCEHLIIKETSDEFFQRINPLAKWNIIFIDGLHESLQVDRDIQNAIKHLKPGGTIVMHDCLPILYEHTTTGVDGCWTGDTYKSAIRFHFAGDGYLLEVVDTDWGVGIITEKEWTDDEIIGIPVYPTLRSLEDWEYFNNNRNKVLNIISTDDFLNKY